MKQTEINIISVHATTLNTSTHVGYFKPQINCYHLLKLYMYLYIGKDYWLVIYSEQLKIRTNLLVNQQLHFGTKIKVLKLLQAQIGDIPEQ